MFTIYIPKSIDRHYGMLIARDYVSNGHWAIHKHIIKNKDWFIDDASLKAQGLESRHLPISAPQTFTELLDRFVGKQVDLVAWQKTDWLLSKDRAPIYRLFVDERNRKAWIDETYYKLLGKPLCLYSKNVELTKDGKFIAPMVSSNEYELARFLLMPVALADSVIPEFPGTVKGSSPRSEQKKISRLFDLSED